MNSPVDDLVFRKKLLVAQSSLHRLRIRNEVRALREGLSWPRAGAVVLGSRPVQSALFLLAAEWLGTERVAVWLANARRALVVAKVALAAVALVRNTAAGKETEPR
jgi:hypothetical protein